MKYFKQMERWFDSKDDILWGDAKAAWEACEEFMDNRRCGSCKNYIEKIDYYAQDKYDFCEIFEFPIHDNFGCRFWESIHEQEKD